VAATISSDKMLGLVRLAEEHPHRITALLGPRDRERSQTNQALPSGFTFVAHPGLSRGQEYQLREPAPQRIRDALGIPASPEALRYAAPLRVRDYRDPLPGFEGNWSAAFAPIDESGFVVVVQSQRDRPAPLAPALERLAAPTGAIFLLGGGLLLSIVARRRR
jgi:hypothetical protein